jgi:hypothetical protein
VPDRVLGRDLPAQTGKPTPLHRVSAAALRTGRFASSPNRSAGRLVVLKEEESLRRRDDRSPRRDD